MSFALVIPSRDLAPYKRNLVPNASPNARLRVLKVGSNKAEVPNRSSSIQMLDSAIINELSSCPTPKRQSEQRTVSLHVEIKWDEVCDRDWGYLQRKVTSASAYADCRLRLQRGYFTTDGEP
jgi:hypothetical protein